MERTQRTQQYTSCISHILSYFCIMLRFRILICFWSTCLFSQTNHSTHAGTHHNTGHIVDHPNHRLEWPAPVDHHQIIQHLGYTLSYNEKHEQADWVAYVLTKEETMKLFNRTNKFMFDTCVSTGSATDADYKNSGYDRGHLAPAADMGWSEQSMTESFYFSNMSPQEPNFNRGVWKKLEEQVREWAIQYDSLCVVTGPILSDSLPSIGEHEVSVPKMYYKVIYDHSPPEKKAIAFLIPNKASKEPLLDFCVTIDELEKVSGLDFFATYCKECWTWRIPKVKRKQ